MRNVILILVSLFVFSSLAAQPLVVGIQIPDHGGVTTLTMTAPCHHVDFANYATERSSTALSSAIGPRTARSA